MRAALSEPEHVLDNLNVNVFGVLNVNKAFLPLLGKGKGKQVFSLSSVCASLEQWGNNVMTPACALALLPSSRTPAAAQRRCRAQTRYPRRPSTCGCRSSLPNSGRCGSALLTRQRVCG